jgi:hypothetical protein
MKFAMTLKQFLLLVLLAAGVMQFVPVERTNPPVEAPLVGPQPVMDIFRRACFDCHSNETVWPWYAKVAPVSWLVAHDVNEARAELNFSNWARLSLRDQDAARAEIWKKIDAGDMPPPFYVLGHPAAQVNTNDHPILRKWCGVEATGY